MAETQSSPVDVSQAVLLLKQRLNRLTGISALDEYLQTLVQAAIQRMGRAGITLTDSVSDLMLVVDMAAWQYANRDKPGTEPEWLQAEKRNRWLQDRQVSSNDP